MGNLEQVKTDLGSQTKAFNFDLKPKAVCHAIRFLQECCDNCYPNLKRQDHYFDEGFGLSKANCFKFVGEVFGPISQAVLIAETFQIPNKIDLFISKLEFVERKYSADYAQYMLYTGKLINFLSNGCNPHFPEEVLQSICSKEIQDIYQSRIDLASIEINQFIQILTAVNQFCRMLNTLSSIQSLFISTVVLTVNKGFAVLVSEFSKLEPSELEKHNISKELYEDLVLFSINLMRFYNRLFSTFLLNQANTSKIHVIMKNFRSLG